jgi:2,5-furandicarboxylate decarboxylase 1
MSLRETLTRLDKQGDLVRIRREVDRRFELAAVAKKLDGGPAALFENVRGASMPVVVGTDGTKDRVAQNLGIKAIELIGHFARAIGEPIPWKQVADGPVRARRLQAPFDVGELLPVPHHYEKEPAPFITGGMVVARDPDSGVLNASYNRMQLKGGTRCGMYVQPRHLLQIHGKNSAQGRPTEVAVIFGMDTAVRLSSATWGSNIPLELDEFAIAGGLRGAAVEMVACQTVDLVVPAEAEIVLEGRILPGVTEPEGPMAEFTGVYGGTDPKHVFEATALMMREDAIYQDIVPFGTEHLLMLGLPYEGVLFRYVRAQVPGLRDVHITPGGCGKFLAALSLTKRHDGDAKNAILGAFGAIRDIKIAMAVDPDIDINNPRELQFALATRVQGDRDIFMIPGAKGNELDPIQDVYDYITKIGIDATKPLARAERFELAKIPGYDDIDLRDYLEHPGT